MFRLWLATWSLFPKRFMPPLTWKTSMSILLKRCTTKRGYIQPLTTDLPDQFEMEVALNTIA